MSLLLNILFETDSYSNGYFFAKFGVDTAENEPFKAWGDPVPNIYNAKFEPK